MRKSLPYLVACFATSALAAPISAQQANQWPTFQANPAHDGWSPVFLDSSSLAFAWESTVGVAALSPVVISDGNLIVSQVPYSTSGIYSLDPGTGALLWDFSAGGGNFSGHPGIANGIAYVQVTESGDEYIRSFDANTGAQLLYTPVDGQTTIFYSPVILDGEIYLNVGRTGGLGSYDALTGTENWFYEMELGDEWSPSIEGDICYGYASGYLSAVDRNTGDELFTYHDFDAETAGVVGETPVIGSMDNLLVVNGGRLTCHEKSDGTIRWSVPDSFDALASPANGLVYAINGGTLEVRDELNGTLLNYWTPLSGALDRNLIVTPDHVLASTADTTYLIDRDTFVDVWDYPAGGWLTLGEGLLLISQDSGTVTAIDYNERPQAMEVSPNRLNYYESDGAIVTVTGFGFDEPGATSVMFGGLAATNVTVIDANTLECTLPEGVPGEFDVVVTDTTGSTTLTDGFTFSPSLLVSGDFVLGGAVQLDMRLEPGLSVAGLYDFGPARGSSVSVPPIEGEYWLEQFGILYEIPSWPFDDDLSLGFSIPNDPSLSGQMIQLQSVVGPNPRGRNGAFTNLVTITIL